MSPQRRPLFPCRPGKPAPVKTPLRLVVTLGAVVALTAACNLFGASSRERLPEDPRFAEFTYKTDDTIEVQERTDFAASTDCNLIIVTAEAIKG